MLAPPHLVVPERREDEVHLDEDGPERQQAPHDGDDLGREVPLLQGDGAGDGLHAAGVVGRAAPVAAHDGADGGEGEGDERPDDEDNELGGGG